MYRKKKYATRKIRGFEYATIRVMWAFDEEQVQVNDIVLLKDKNYYSVLKKNGEELFIRLINTSDYVFIRERMSLMGVGYVSGQMGKERTKGN